MGPGRYRLTLTMGGRVVSTGWWGLLATAERQFTVAVGQYGVAGTEIVLVDLADGERVLKRWP